MTAKHTSTASSTQEHVLHMIAPLVRWLIRSGIGYTEFSTSLKSVFFTEALHEAQRIRHKTTDSSLSLLAGLHRKDINTLRAQMDVENPEPINKSISMSAQVAGRWMALNLPSRIPFQMENDNEQMNFIALVRTISNDLHPRSVCNELKRLGAVSEADGMVQLESKAFIPDAYSTEARNVFAHNIADHLAAGVHNLTIAPNTPEMQFLEQSVFADALTPDSIEKLKSLSLHTWQKVMQQVLQEAIALDQVDTQSEQATQRFRVGVYVYAEGNTATQTTEQKNTKGQS